MNVKTFFTITSVVVVVYGAFFLLMPEKAHEIYGITDMMNESSIRFQRFFGGALVSTGLMVFMARAAGPSIGRKAILLFLTVSSLINAILIGTWLIDGAPSISIIDLIVTAVITIGSAYFFFKEEE